MSEHDRTDPNHDIVPTLRMFNGLMTGKAADEIERLRNTALGQREGMDRALRRARRRYFDNNPPNTWLAIAFNDLLKINGTYEQDHEANARREVAANGEAAPTAPAQAASGGEVVERIDPMQDPMRPAYFMNYAADETPAEQVLRKLACWLGVGGYNAPKVDAELFHRKIVDGVEMLVKSAASAPPAGDPPAPAAAREVVEALRSIIDDADRNLAAINTPRLVAAKEALVRYDAAKTL